MLPCRRIWAGNRCRTIFILPPGIDAAAAARAVPLSEAVPRTAEWGAGSATLRPPLVYDCTWERRSASWLLR